MRTKQLPMVEEMPLIAVGLAVAAAGTLAAAALVEAARLAVRLTGSYHPMVQPGGAR